jgi:hypothetical protein
MRARTRTRRHPRPRPTRLQLLHSRLSRLNRTEADLAWNAVRVHRFEESLNRHLPGSLNSQPATTTGSQTEKDSSR